MSHSLPLSTTLLTILAATLGVTLTVGPGTSAEAQSRRRTPAAMSMMATAYCDGGTTKSGTQAASGTAAADPAVLPIGTVIRFVPPGARRAQTFTIADTGAAVKGREVDVFIADCARAKRFGRQRVLVTIVQAAPAAASR